MGTSWEMSGVVCVSCSASIITLAYYRNATQYLNGGRVFVRRVCYTSPTMFSIVWTKYSGMTVFRRNNSLKNVWTYHLQQLAIMSDSVRVGTVSTGCNTNASDVCAINITYLLHATRVHGRFTLPVNTDRMRPSTASPVDMGVQNDACRTYLFI